MARPVRHPGLRGPVPGDRGQPIRHVADNGHGPIAWVAAYEAAYGPLPEIWFTDADGTVGQDVVARYRETGTVVAEWDCGPAGGDGGDVAPDQPETARRWPPAAPAQRSGPPPGRCASLRPAPSGRPPWTSAATRGR
ncbi:hypothetical protein [Streptomyces sp. NPDC017095]|uniref:hypothetical protein n=1 Tax=Streptomyces sp. NPDC017095 TaxID=3364977 RepID=UPI0037B9AF7E